MALALALDLEGREGVGQLGPRAWAPGDEVNQFDHVIDRELALAARHDLAAHPALVRVIDDVLAKLEQEAEEDREHEAWLRR